MPRETTIRELLERGRARMEAERLADLERQKALADEATEQWNCLVDAVTADLGEELAATVTPKLVQGQVPPSFRKDASHFGFKMKPFDAGEILFNYKRDGDSWMLGYPCGDRDDVQSGPPGFIVGQNYHSAYGDLFYKFSKDAANLAEAIALCDLQTQGYLEAKEGT